jgi:hypothetical protein
MAESDSIAPDDRDLVFAAARLGWAMAELHGRVRETAERSVTDAVRPAGVLPLGQERSQKEQLIEYFSVIRTLAQRLGVDVPADQITGHPDNIQGSAAEWLRRAAWSVATTPDPTEPAAIAAANDLRTVYYGWDARIQDEFASRPSLSAAYQVARGVAEIRWQFGIEAGGDPDYDAGVYLLGLARGARLDRLIDRLSEYYDPVTRHALQTSLASWRIADEATTKAPDASWRAALARQATIWHDLILGQRTGASLISPRDVLQKPASLVPVLLRLWPETLLILLGAVLLTAAAAFIATPGFEERLPAITGVLGVLGITFGTISARARASANDLISALRNDLYRSLVADKAIVPNPTAARD